MNADLYGEAIVLDSDAEEPCSNRLQEGGAVEAKKWLFAV